MFVATVVVVAMALALWLGGAWSGPPASGGTPAGTVARQAPAVAVEDGERVAAGGRDAAPGVAAAPGTRPVRLRILDAAGAPAAGAEVVWGDEAAVVRAGERVAEARRHGQGSPEAMALPDRLRAVGVTTHADDRGEVHLMCEGGHLVVSAAKGGLAAQQTFTVPTAGADLVLVLMPGDTLRVRLLDVARRPIASAPLVVTWPSAPGDGPRTTMAPLGRTDGNGEIAFAGWRAFHRSVREQLPALREDLRVAPGWAGGDAHAVAVPEAALEAIVVVAARPMACRVRLVDAMTEPLPWSGLVLDVRSPGGSVASHCVVQEGAGEIELAPGVGLRWTLSGLGHGLGAGDLVGGEAEAELRTEVVAVTGVCRPRAAGPLQLEFASRVRTGGSESVATGDDGRFRVQIARADLGREVTFRRGERMARVALPATSEASLDLGVIDFVRVAPAAHLRVVGDDDAPHLQAQASLTGARDQAMPDGVRSLGAGRFEIFAVDTSAAWQVHVTAPGCLPRFVEVRRGADAVVRLERAGPRRVALQVAADMPCDDVWLRLRERLDAESGAWRPVELTFEHWAQARAAPSGARAVFPDAPAGRYRCEVLSVRPVHTLAEVELDLGGNDPPTVDLLSVRTVAMRVTGPDGAGHHYLVAGSEWRRDPDRQPLRLRRVAFGDQRWTLRADEREVWVVAARLLPALAVPREGGTVACTAAATVLPEPSAEILRPRSPWLHERRPVHRYEPDAAGMSRPIARWQDLPGGAPLWPCDYEARIAGVVRTAAWTGSGWRLAD